MVAIVHRLLQEPYTVFSLGTFAEALGAAKSTISEDIASLRRTFEQLALGRIETLAGATGGVRFVPCATPEQYTADLLSLPGLVARLGDVFATFFADRRPDVVLSMEVQGIPLALMTARAFNVPLVTARRGSMGREGPSVGVNYVSGSSRTVQSMTLPLRAVPPGARALFVDDFLRGGGTARGVHDLMREFQAEIVGIGVLIETAEPREKLVDQYISLLVFDGVDEARGLVRVSPSPWVSGQRVR